MFVHFFPRRLSVVLPLASILILAGRPLWLGIAARVTHSKTVASSNTVSNSPPTLVGSEAVDYLKQQGLYNSLAEAITMARHSAQPLPSAESPLTIDPSLTQQAKLTANDGAASDFFGSSVAIYADIVVVGAPLSGSIRRGAAYVFSRSGSAWGLEQKLTADDGAASDLFGSSVAIHAGTIVVGAFNDDIGGNQGQGAAYVFTRAGPAWSLQQKLTADDGAASDLFGRSVAIYGDTIVAGAINADIGGNQDQGAAYVFARSGSAWSLQQKLMADDGSTDDNLGFSVAIHADTIVVGSHRDDIGGNNDQGSAYVFARAGLAWSQQQKLIAADGAASDFFGDLVAIYADTIVVGSPGDDIGGNRDQGSAYVFARSGSTWSLQQKLIAADGAAGDVFGSSVAIHADTIVVGAPHDDVGGKNNPGSAYVFVRADSTWSRQQKLTAADGEAFDRFGSPAAVYADKVVAGAPSASVGPNVGKGAVYVFAVCGDLAQQQKLMAGDGAALDAFGSSVAIYADTVVVGASRGDGRIMNQGAAFVFVRVGPAWSLQQKLTADNGEDFDFFGSSVAIHADTIVVGAPGDNIGGNNDQGSAYVFARADFAWIPQQKLIAPDGAAGDEFGSSVTIDGGTVVVGAFRADIGGNRDQGAAYVFTRADSVWSLQQKLTADDGSTGASFGFSVAIHANRIVVGASNDDIGGNEDQGSAYIFVLANNWIQQQKFTANDGAAFNRFGSSVAIHADTIVVGVPFHSTGGNREQGSAYVFVRVGLVWSLQQKLTANNGAAFDLFGFSVAIYAETVVVGTHFGGNINQGSAYVFARDGSTWGLRQELTAEDGAADELLGDSVAIYLGTVVAGAPMDVIDGKTSQGSAYVFACSGCSTIELAPDALPNGVAGRAYSQNITASGAAEPFCFSLSSGSLPLGLALSQTGLISGIPVEAGGRKITITAISINGCVGARDYTLTILPNPVTTVSAASYAPALAPKEIVAGFGVSLANSTAAASSLPLPTALAGTSVMVKDSNGVERAAPLFFVSPLQINYQIPGGAAPGAATVTVFIGTEAVATGAAQIVATAPAIFTSTSTGIGPATAIDALTGAAPPFNATQANGEPNIISVYGTGLGADATDVDGNVNTTVQALIDGNPVTVLYAGRAPGFVGSNQFNIALFVGITSGAHTLTIARGGSTTNTVTITIK